MRRTKITAWTRLGRAREPRDVPPGIPPLDLFDARSGDWQRRKAYWKSLGIRSEIGRAGNLLQFSDTILQPDPKKRAALRRARRRGD